MRTDGVRLSVDDALDGPRIVSPVSLRFEQDVAREIVEALSRIEAAHPGRRFIYTVATESEATGVGNAEHTGLLRAHGDDSVTIGTDAGDVEIGWYEITSIAVAPD